MSLDERIIGHQKNTYVSFFPFYTSFFFFSHDEIYEHGVRKSRSYFNLRRRYFLDVARTDDSGLFTRRFTCLSREFIIRFRTGRNNSGRENIFLALNNVQNSSTKGPAQGSGFNLREIFVRCGG